MNMLNVYRHKTAEEQRRIQAVFWFGLSTLPTILAWGVLLLVAVPDQVSFTQNMLNVMIAVRDTSWQFYIQTFIILISLYLSVVVWRRRSTQDDIPTYVLPLGILVTVISLGILWEVSALSAVALFVLFGHKIRRNLVK